MCFFFHFKKILDSVLDNKQILLTYKKMISKMF